MQYTQLYEKAMEIASEAHSGQFDKGGMPYILHPIAVSAKCATNDAKIAALLHDTVEDSDFVTLQCLADDGFPKQIVDAVDALTRREYESYSDFISRVSEDPIATEVKIADLEHNMDLTRLKCITKTDIDRIRKYHKHWKKLKAAFELGTKA